VTHCAEILRSAQGDNVLFLADNGFLWAASANVVVVAKEIRGVIVPR
jgi:hypothetical protein